MCTPWESISSTAFSLIYRNFASLELCNLNQLRLLEQEWKMKGSHIVSLDSSSRAAYTVHVWRERASQPKGQRLLNMTVPDHDIHIQSPNQSPKKLYLISSLSSYKSLLPIHHQIPNSQIPNPKNPTFPHLVRT
jgi:hypothetical protein